nr:sugar ABC transporter permease [Bacillota bacterium]
MGEGGVTLSPSALHRGPSQRPVDLITGLLMVAPLLVVIVGVMGAPLLQAVSLSLTDKRIGLPGTFVGWGNYGRLVHDPLFWLAVRNSFLFAFGAVALKLLAGFGLALVLNEELPWRGLWRAIILIPWAVPELVAALTWRWMYSDTNGIINALLLRAGLIEFPVPWLGSPQTALAAVVLINVWKGVPFFTFSLLGGLQVIDAELYEAAAIDGAGWASQVRHIVLPALAPVMVIASLLSTIWTFNDFTTIFVTTGGGPAYATTTVPILTYEKAFWNLELGYAVATSLAAAPVFIGLIVLATRLFAGRER